MSNPPTSTFRRWLSLMGRLALIVSVWNAPLPMLHAHGTDLDDSPSATEFADHLAEYHPDAPINSHFDFGWHWHLVPLKVNHPGDENSDGQCPFCPLDSHDTLLQTQSSTAVNSFGVWSATSWLSIVQPSAAPVDQVHQLTTRYLDTYLGSVPLGTLLRVARC
jgi:hypothetical protein